MCVEWCKPSCVDAPYVWNPHARFAIYERVDDDTEDETLLDLWVDEGLAHPRVNGSWDRPAARAWLEAGVTTGQCAGSRGDAGAIGSMVHTA